MFCRNLGMIVAAAILVVACMGPEGPPGMNGTDGTMGTMGIQGDPGPMGDPGMDGLNCWDTNGDGIPDLTEDTNSDDVWTAADCRGLPVYTNPETGQQYSLEASYCGQTAPMTGNAGGYAGAKTLCEATCGTPTAHLCTATEVVRFQTTGGTMPPEQVWLSSGTSSLSPDVTQRFSDCHGFNQAAGDLRGTTWLGERPDSQLCINSLPLACCD